MRKRKRNPRRPAYWPYRAFYYMNGKSGERGLKSKAQVLKFVAHVKSVDPNGHVSVHEKVNDFGTYRHLKTNPRRKRYSRRRSKRHSRRSR